MRRCMLLALLTIIPFIALAQKNPLTSAEFDSYVEKVIKRFEVPGVCVAVVKDGKIILAKGYGVRELGKSAKVDSKTLFGIASNTKAFTATALGLLVEEEKIKWDGRVIDYLPWFQLSDPYVTRELTIRDLLVHRSGLGLGAGDLLWWPPSTYDRKEIARRLRHIPLKTSFRSAYAYDNVLYTVAGEVIETISGMTWEDFVQKRILDVVGMTTSNVRHSDAVNGGNIATTHAEVEGTVRVIKPFASDNTNPAGGINSNAEDMAKWMIVQMDSGRVSKKDKRLFSPQTARDLWSIVTPMRIGTPPPELAPLQANFLGYALGFFIRDYRGYKLVEHTGGLPGYVSQVMMIPEIKAGVCVLTNQESGAAFNAISLYVLDHYLKASHDWLGALGAVVARGDSMMKARESSITSSRPAESAPSLPIEKYAGTYRDAWYGDIAITNEQGGMVIRFTKTPDLVGDLEHWQHDTFVAKWKDRELRADAFVTFSLSPDGSIEQAKMRAVSPATDFSFDFQDLSLKPVKSER